VDAVGTGADIVVDIAVAAEGISHIELAEGKLALCTFHHAFALISPSTQGTRARILTRCNEPPPRIALHSDFLRDSALDFQDVDDLRASTTESLQARPRTCTSLPQKPPIMVSAGVLALETIGETISILDV
jgi:hypothetical protein